MAPPLTHFLKTTRLWLPLLLMTLPGLSAGQTGTPATTGNITEKKRLVILPAIDETDDTGFSINREVNRVVASVAARLGRFDIIDRNDLEAILQEQDLALLGLVDDSSAVEIGRIAAAQEALRITVLNFHQIGVPKDSDKKEEEEKMCDYSLESYRSIPAREGERYIDERFDSGSIGFASPGDCSTAVCVQADTRLRLSPTDDTRIWYPLPSDNLLMTLLQYHRVACVLHTRKDEMACRFIEGDA
ncbi:MAG: hypothetical protein IIB43_06695 [Candidatus Marinimicrobia bacterium]|nr:hypothetical protein [Candidatus Neomarinimicrobiota bacterium]